MNGFISSWKESGVVGFSVRCWIGLIVLMVLPGMTCLGYGAELKAAPFASGVAAMSAQVEPHGLPHLAYPEDPASRTDLAMERSGKEPDMRKAGTSSPKPDPWDDEGESAARIPDPLEPVNRAVFEFNDKLYFWVLKPVGTGYKTVVPEVGRVCIRNFFTNLIMPIRAVSCLLQGKFQGFGIELVRGLVNTSVGFLGFQDVAKDALGFQSQDEDLGQAFAFYGIGPGLYLNLPFLGASTLRDTAGWVGELYLNPLDYMVNAFWPNVGCRAFDTVNRTSLRIGEYESLKRAALDPYVAMRDAYYQYRLNQIEK